MLFFYLSMFTGAAVAGLSLLPGGTWAGLAVGALWAAFPFALPYLEQPARQPQRPTGYMREVLTRVAKGTLTFFETAMTDADHALPPDNVQIEPNKGVSHRTSPTNIGLYLCALGGGRNGCACSRRTKWPAAWKKPSSRSKSCQSGKGIFTTGMIRAHWNRWSRRSFLRWTAATWRPVC